MSPYGQKTKLLLTLAGVPFQRCDQPVVLPRPDLEALAITYRRIPLLAVGRDVYCDSSLIIDVVLDKLAKGKVPTSPTDKAWESWGYQLFVAVLTLAPNAVVDNKDFVKDRQDIFPVLGRPDYKTLRPSGLAEFVSRLSFIENEVLAKSPFVSGEKLGLADLHVVFGIRWAFNDLGVASEKAVGKDAFPKVWNLIESLPEVSAETIGSDETIKAIKNAELSVKDVRVDESDPTDISSGTEVTVESTE